VSIINGKVVQGWAFSAGRLVRKKSQEGTQGGKNRTHTKLPGLILKKIHIDNCKLIKYYSYYFFMSKHNDLEVLFV
jgi:hypothetical protein